MKRAVWKWLFYAKAPAHTTLGWDDICSKRNDCQECKEKDHLSRSVLIVAHSRTISSTRSQLVKHRRVVTSLVSIVLSSIDHIMVISMSMSSVSMSSMSIIMAGVGPVQVAYCHLDVPKSSIQHLAHQYFHNPEYGISDTNRHALRSLNLSHDKKQRME